MRRIRHTLTVLFLGPVLLSGAVAASAQGLDPEDRFTLMDADNDGLVSWKEFSAVNPNISERGFGVIDTNGDGRLTRDEWRVFSANHGGSMAMPGTTEKLPARDAEPPRAPLVMPPRAPETSDSPVPGAVAPEAPSARPGRDPRMPSGPAATTPPLVRPPQGPESGMQRPGQPVRQPGPPLVTPPREPVTEELKMAPSRSGETRTEVIQ